MKFPDLIKSLAQPHCEQCNGTGYVKGLRWPVYVGEIEVAHSTDNDTVCMCVPEIVFTSDGMTVDGKPYSDTEPE